MTPASQQALIGLRDLTTLKWYVIPLLAIVCYIYTKELKEARETNDWNGVFAGLTIFGMDFINETWNGLIFHFTQHSAFWTAPGETALRTMVGWNIEIMFMFAILGIVYYHSLPADRTIKVWGLPIKWVVALGFTAFCVFVECLLNIGGHLVWEYPWWYRSFAGVWLIFLIGYFHFFVAAIIVIGMKSNRHKLITVSALYVLPLAVNVLCLGVLDWVY